MSPIDEELHDALHTRAATLTAPPDPMAGIERRAAGIRRRRLTAALAGGALVVAAAVVVVPSLLPGSPTAHLTPAAPTTQAPTPTTQATTSPPAAAPGNLLPWPTRGAGESDLMPAAKQALAPNLGATADEVQLKILFSGDTDSGVRFLMGQAWKNGADTAHPFSYSEGQSGGPRTFIGPANKATPPALAFVLDSLPGTVGELLVVIPTPRTGQVSYDDDATGSFRPISGQDHFDGVVLIDRRSGETDDRIEILDGNGDLDNPTYRGPVQPFLCGLKECG